MGREYPAGFEFFRTRLRTAFRKNRAETDPEKITTLIGRGEFVVKEIDALYKLRKYRHLKKSYYDNDKPIWENYIKKSINKQNKQNL